MVSHEELLARDDIARSSGAPRGQSPLEVGHALGRDAGAAGEVQRLDAGQPRDLLQVLRQDVVTAEEEVLQGDQPCSLGWVVALIVARSVAVSA